MTDVIGERRDAPVVWRRIGGLSPVTARERELVNAVLDSGVIYGGEYTRRFEMAIAKAHQRRVALLTNSGGSALELATAALKRQRGWRDGDEVLVPAITFVATINPVIHSGLRPVFVDVDPLHLDLDPSLLESRITARTRAIIPVHFFGQPCQMEEIMAVARRHDLAVIEDACETMFMRRGGRVVGSWGDIACFSTFTVHPIATGVGGLVATDDVELAVTMRNLANHGAGTWQLRFEGEVPVWTDPGRGEGFADAGWSLRLTDLEAALGLAQLERWEEIAAAYRHNAERLTERLADLRGVLQLPSVRPGSEHWWWRYAILVTDPAASRDALLDHLNRNGVPARYLYPILSQPVYVRLFGDQSAAHPVAARVDRTGIVLGTHGGLSDADIDRYADVIHAFFRG